MSDIPKLTKDPDLRGPKKGGLGKTLILAGTLLAGIGIVQPAPAQTNTSGTASLVAPNSVTAIDPAPLVLKPAQFVSSSAQHRSHVSHASHRSHSSHRSRAF